MKCSVANKHTSSYQEHHQEGIPHSRNSMSWLLSNMRFFDDHARHAGDRRTLQLFPHSLDPCIVPFRAWIGSRSHDRCTHFGDLWSLCRLQGLCKHFHALHPGSWLQRLACQPARVQIPRRCDRRPGACCRSRDECRHV